MVWTHLLQNVERERRCTERHEQLQRFRDTLKGKFDLMRSGGCIVEIKNRICNNSKLQSGSSHANDADAA